MAVCACVCICGDWQHGGRYVEGSFEFPFSLKEKLTFGLNYRRVGRVTRNC